jgi:hypothetical protein
VFYQPAAVQPGRPRGIGKAVVEGDSFYTIAADANEEIFSVKRYKMMWRRAD